VVGDKGSVREKVPQSGSKGFGKAFAMAMMMMMMVAEDQLSEAWRREAW
jgi:hypothetical protein